MQTIYLTQSIFGKSFFGMGVDSKYYKEKFIIGVKNAKSKITTNRYRKN